MENYILLFINGELYNISEKKREKDKVSFYSDFKNNYRIIFSYFPFFYYFKFYKSIGPVIQDSPFFR